MSLDAILTQSYDVVLAIVRLVYFMLPAYFANMAPVFARNHLEFLNKPLDMGLHVRYRAVFGKNKTLRGLIVGVIVGVLTALGQYYLQPAVPSLYLVFFGLTQSLLVGILLSTGALIGDLVKSFFKRQLDIAPGQSWIPFDQIDYALGALVFISSLYFVGWLNCAYILIISVILHFATNLSGYALGMREHKW